jgi:hypothetical protein
MRAAALSDRRVEPSSARAMVIRLRAERWCERESVSELLGLVTSGGRVSGEPGSAPRRAPLDLNCTRERKAKKEWRQSIGDIVRRVVLAAAGRAPSPPLPSFICSVTPRRRLTNGPMRRAFFAFFSPSGNSLLCDLSLRECIERERERVRACMHVWADEFYGVGFFVRKNRQ